jgi:phosphoglycerate dehydrogenase-like enzyme
MPLKVLTLWGLTDQMQATIKEILQPVAGKLVMIPDANGGYEEGKQKFNHELIDTEVLLAGALNAEGFAVAKALKWIQVPSAGVNRLLDTKGLIESDVIVTNSAGTMAGPLADQVLGYVIGFSRMLPQQWQAQKERKWNRVWGGNIGVSLRELAGDTIGIIGYGNIGREIAKRAKAFGMRVVATKQNISGNYPELDQLWPNQELEQLLTQSDYVVIAAPLTPETTGMIGRTQLLKMKPSAYLINIARGPLVKEAELIEVLQQKQIAGAALDVFEKEPLPVESPLWDLDNVILTPHSSGNFDKYMERAVERFTENLRRYVNHQPLINVVDKQRGY